MLFFSTRGMVYKLKVYRLPLGTPQARGKALVNLLPLEEGETISTLMPLPEDEASWDEIDVMFATATGDVRRNKLSDFVNVMANGKIAMKLDEGDRLIGVQPAPRTTTCCWRRGGRCIRFPVGDVRVFTGRTSTGVRGIRLAEGDEVISLSILRHVDVETAEREAYLRYAAPSAAPRARRRASPMARRGSAGAPGRARGPRRSSSSRSPPRATASAPRPMSTASPTAAGRASPISRSPSATARWSPPSRSRTRTRSCW